MVEFALIGLVFFTVLFTVFEFGRTFWVINTLAEATRDGARLAAIGKEYETIKQQMAAKANLNGFSGENLAITCSDGLVTASIIDYSLNLVFIGNVSMPSCTTTVPIESSNNPAGCP